MLVMSFLRKHHEVARKLVHVSYGATFALLSIWLSKHLILLIALLSLVVLLILRTMHFTNLLYQVHRVSYGELFYALGIIAAVLLGQTTHEVVSAILVLSLADSAASLIGKSIPSPTWTTVYFTSSMAGSAAFYVVALVVLTATAIIFNVYLPFLAVVIIALAAAITEGTSPYGIDNLLIPVVIVSML